MKIKSTVNLLVDLILFVLIIPTMLTRHQIHEIAGYSFGLFILIHLLLHGKQIFAMMKTWLPNSRSPTTPATGAPCEDPTAPPCDPDGCGRPLTKHPGAVPSLPGPCPHRRQARE